MGVAGHNLKVDPALKKKALTTEVTEDTGERNFNNSVFLNH